MTSIIKISLLVKRRIAVFPFLSALSSDPFFFIKGQEKRSGTPTADKKESTPTVHNPYRYRKCAVRDLVASL